MVHSHYLRSRYLRVFLWTMVSGLWTLFVPGVLLAQTVEEARFFADCPHGRKIRLHHETDVWDAHAALYTVLGVSEVEILRAADWLIDLPIPDHALHPFQRTTHAIRTQYHRLPRWWVIERVGEFVDALRIAELSFGDASSTYSVATGGSTGPGSGMIVRVDRLIDWSQHVVGDLNQVSGHLVGRPQGALAWSWPGRAVDGLQWMVMKTATHVMVLMSRIVEDAVSAGEMGAERVMNISDRSPHEPTTVFLRLPLEVYRAHELWILEHRDRLVIGRAADFAQTTHAALAHHRRHLAAKEWDPVKRLDDPTQDVILMTTTRIIARAPASLRPYVVPAAWILHPDFRPQEQGRG